MTSGPIEQQKRVLGTHIVDNLMVLRSKLGFTTREIAEKLGMNENYLSKVLTGKKLGSPQLLAGLLLLKELTELKRSGVNHELSRELESMKQRIEQLQRQTSSRYPDHVPQHAELNTPKSAAEEASSTPGGAVAIKAARVAVRAAEKDPRDPPLKK